MNILSIFNQGGRISLGWLWPGLGYCALSCCHWFNQIAFFGIVLHPVIITTSFWDSTARRGGNAWAAMPGQPQGITSIWVVAMAWGCSYAQPGKVVLLGEAPLLPASSLLGPLVLSLGETLRNVSLLYTLKYREQKLHGSVQRRKAESWCHSHCLSLKYLFCV